MPQTHLRAATAVSTIALCAAACGGGASRPTVDSSPTAPAAPPPSPPANTWTITGMVVDTVTQAAIPGARIAPGWELEAVIADGAGAYSLGAIANPQFTPYELNVSADGHVPHKQYVNWQAGTRQGVVLDLIRDAAPFSIEFYRQFVRGTYDSDGPWPVLRWMEAPSFYVKTVDQNGRPVEPEVMAVVLDALARSVPAFTGGRYSAGAIETGTSQREPTQGWIIVDIVGDPTERTTCGTAYVGRNPGEITLYNDVCSCGSNKIPGTLVMHEVGHALGFFHVPDPESVMYPFMPGNCPAGVLSRDESYHAAIAYSRPRGNRDPDDDPPSFGLFGPSTVAAPPHRITN